MRKLFYLFAIALLISACGTETKNTTENETLAKTSRSVIYEVDLTVDPDFTNWMGNTDTKKLIQGIFDQVENGERIAYQPVYVPSDEGSIMTWDDITAVFGESDTIQIMNAETGEWQINIIPPMVDLREITKVIFIEEWSTDSDGKIIKDVLGIAPVRTYSSTYNDSTEVEKKRIAFVTYFGDKMPWLFE